MGSITLLAVAACALSAGVGQVSDLQKAFEMDANPHLGWSLGFGATPTDFQLFKDVRQVEGLYSGRGQTGLKGWSRPDSIFPFAACNLGKETYYQRWRPGDVVLHPSADLYSVARWTNSGDAATVHIYVTFRRVEDVTGNVPQWYIVANGAVVDSGDLVLGDEEKSVTEVIKVPRGGSVSVVVGCKDGRPDGTDLNVRATIKS